MDKRVNLFIAGVNKAGTTWLFHLLKNHPDIQFSQKKELNYFNKTYPAALQEYHANFDFSREEIYFAEATPAYVRSAATAEKIKKYNPDAKIIIMLRDPIQRLLSQFYFRKQVGKIAERLSLDQAVHGEDEIIVSDSHYELFLPSWIRLFAKDNIKIVSMEKALEKKKEFWRDIQRFLKIKEIPMPQVIHQSKNVTGSKNFRLLYKVTVLPIKRHVPALYQQLLHSGLMKASKKYFLKKFGTQSKKISLAVLEHLKKEFSDTYSYLFTLGFKDVYERTRNNLESVITE